MQDNWSNKIHKLEIPPLKEAWQHIVNELDKENKNILRTKMLAYETNSPVSVLTNIFTQLNIEEETATPAFVERIKKCIQTSPAAAWQNIINRLYKNDNVIQLYPKQRSINTVYVRRTAAAAAVIAILWTSFLFINKKEQTYNDAAINAKQAALPSAGNTSSPIRNSNSTSATAKNMETKEPQKNNIASSTTGGKTIVAQPVQTIQTIPVPGQAVKDLAQQPGTNDNEKLKNAKGETPMDIALINTPNNNISMTGANGQSVKVSSKFSNLVNTASSNPRVKENLDIIIEESPKWRAIIEAWRKKMAGNSIAPSINIIELGKMLEENK